MKVVPNYRNKWLMLALTALALGGCSEKQSAGPTLTPVTGTITLDGQPLPDAEIEFHYKGSAPDGYEGASSQSDLNGVFQVKSGEQLGIIPGLHRVTVTRNDSDVQPEIPKKYRSLDTTDLELKVSSDKATGYVLKLSSTAQ